YGFVALRWTVLEPPDSRPIASNCTIRAAAIAWLMSHTLSARMPMTSAAMSQTSTRTLESTSDARHLPASVAHCIEASSLDYSAGCCNGLPQNKPSTVDAAFHPSERTNPYLKR